MTIARKGIQTLGLLACAGLVSCGNDADVAKSTETPAELSVWGERAVMDIKAGHELMLSNHPGPVDSQNPKFGAVAQTALNDALGMAQKVVTALDYSNALSAYSAHFRDGHFGLIQNDKFWDGIPENENIDNWAGMIMGWRDGKFSVVHAADFAGVDAGAQLFSCDGKSADDMMRDNVFRFRRQGPEIKTHYALFAYNLIRDRGNSFVTRQKECTFGQNDEALTITLNWQPFSKDDRQTYVPKALFGDDPETGVTEIENGVYWINLPNFAPQTDADIKAVNDLIETIETNHKTYQNARAIVFDMRGNGGGNSLWGYRVLAALYGAKYVDYQTHNPGVDIDWRAAQGSIKKMKEYEANYEREGNEEYIDYFAKIIGGIENAIANGDTFYTEQSNDDRPPLADSHDVKAKTYLFTHGWCASACLDFADQFKAMGGGTHLGFPTASDSLYMDIRLEDLPSTYGRIILPMKVYRNRPRGNGAYYTPDIPYNAYNWTDDSIQSWFLGSVLPE